MRVQGVGGLETGDGFFVVEGVGPEEAAGELELGLGGGGGDWEGVGAEVEVGFLIMHCWVIFGGGHCGKRGRRFQGNKMTCFKMFSILGHGLLVLAFADASNLFVGFLLGLIPGFRTCRGATYS